MNKTVICAALAFGSMLTVRGEEIKLETEAQKVSYIIGNRIGQQMKQDDVQIDTAALAAGMKDILDGTTTKIPEAEAQAIMMAFQQKMMAKAQETQAKAGAENVEAGKKYLDENKKQEGVTVTESGLQYKIVKAGEGAKPTATDTVKVHYRGTLIDGTEFDSSYKRGEPIEFGVGGVIKGWTEALQLMPIGSKWELVIPSDLAYGERGAGADISPNSVLKFEVELLDIVKPAKPAEPAKPTEPAK